MEMISSPSQNKLRRNVKNWSQRIRRISFYFLNGTYGVREYSEDTKVQNISAVLLILTIFLVHSDIVLRFWLIFAKIFKRRSISIGLIMSVINGRRWNKMKIGKKMIRTFSFRTKQNRSECPARKKHFVFFTRPVSLLCDVTCIFIASWWDARLIN